MQKSEKPIGNGEVFGNFALHGSQKGQMRSATIVAETDAHFAVLNREDYDVLTSEL